MSDALREKILLQKEKNSIYSAEVVKELEQAIMSGSNITEACLIANISRQTLYNWFKENPTLKERFDELKRYPNLLAKQSVINAITKDPKLALDYLKQTNKKFNPKQQIEHSGGIKYVEVSDEEFDEVIKNAKLDGIK